MIRNAFNRYFLRRTLSFSLALILIFSVPATVMAATYTASNTDEMVSSWAAASDNTDTENFIQITDNIDLSGHILEVESQKRYHVQSQDNGDYALSNVHLNGGDDGGVVISEPISLLTKALRSQLVVT